MANADPTPEQARRLLIGWSWDCSQAAFRERHPALLRLLRAAAGSLAAQLQHMQEQDRADEGRCS